MNDLIDRQTAIQEVEKIVDSGRVRALPTMEDGEDWIRVSDVRESLIAVPPAEPEEVIPHRNYKYFSDYWCECGWHLGKKGDVKYCAECGRKVKWDG